MRQVLVFQTAGFPQRGNGFGDPLGMIAQVFLAQANQQAAEGTDQQGLHRQTGCQHLPEQFLAPFDEMEKARRNGANQSAEQGGTQAQ